MRPVSKEQTTCDTKPQLGYPFDGYFLYDYCTDLERSGRGQMRDLSGLNYHEALEDFLAARAKGALESILSRLSGTPVGLMQYEEVRRRFSGVESADRKLKEIPLDAIIGSLSRTKDYTRNLLPLNSEDKERWARVKTMMDDLSGLPPIEVYQVGEAYFIIDGHHRASVARESGARHIEAYVREVKTRVPLTPEDDFEDVILKSEFDHFLSKTGLDKSRSQVDLRSTIPDDHRRLLDQIARHQQTLSAREKRDVPFDQAASDWVDQVYLPVVELLRARNVMQFFSDRTETDVYVWIMEYLWRSEQELGWKLTPRDAIQNFTFNYSRDIGHRLSRLQKKLIYAFAPAPLEPSLPPGFWRQFRKKTRGDEKGLFDSVLVALPGTDLGWSALEAALFVAKNEQAVVSGLTVLPEKADVDAPAIQAIRSRFLLCCERAGIEGRMAVETGQVRRVVYERSFWVDLVVAPMSYPPPYALLKRLNSGLRALIRRCAAPLLLVPPGAAPTIRNALLAYGGGRLADEALSMAAYLCLRFKMELTVITIGETDEATAALRRRAQTYLESMTIRIVTYLQDHQNPARAILNACQSTQCDLVLMGGYEGGLLKELFKGSTVDRVLQDTRCMVMICR